MKKILILAVLAGGLTFNGFAQVTQEKQKKSPQERAEMKTKKMQEELDLNNNQVQKINAINKEHATKMEAYHNEHRAEKEKMRAERKAIHDSYDAQVKGVLTKDQFAKYQEKKEAHRNEMKQKHYGKHKKDRMKKVN